MYARTHAHAHARTHAHTHTHRHTDTHTHTHTHTRAHTHTRTHVHTHAARACTQPEYPADRGTVSLHGPRVRLAQHPQLLRPPLVLCTCMAVRGATRHVAVPPTRCDTRMRNGMFGQSAVTETGATEEPRAHVAWCTPRRMLHAASQILHHKWGWFSGGWVRVGYVSSHRC